ncbi:hypothetical protein FHG87_021429, partial [Trinorchestia longiramus]
PRHLPRLPSRPRPIPATPPPVTPQQPDTKPPWALRPPLLSALTPPSSSDQPSPNARISRSSSLDNSPKTPSSPVPDSPVVELVLECGRRRTRKAATASPNNIPTAAWKTPPPSGDTDVFVR